MKITRQQVFDIWDNNHCPKCNKKQDMEPVRTGLPGIACRKCPECDTHFQANFLESSEDIFDCPDDWIFAT